MTPYGLGIKTAQQRNVPDHLKAAYARGFEKAAITAYAREYQNLSDASRARLADLPPREVPNSFVGRGATGIVKNMTNPNLVVKQPAGTDLSAFRVAGGQAAGFGDTARFMRQRPNLFTHIEKILPNDRGFISERVHAPSALSNPTWLQRLRIDNAVNNARAQGASDIGSYRAPSGGPLALHNVGFRGSKPVIYDPMVASRPVSPVGNMPTAGRPVSPVGKVWGNVNDVKRAPTYQSLGVTTLPGYVRAHAAQTMKPVSFTAKNLATSARDTFTPWQAVRQVGQIARDSMPYVRAGASQTADLARSALTAAKPYAGQVKNVAAGAGTAALAAGKAYAAPAAAAAGKFVALPAAAAAAGTGIGYGARRLSNHLSGGLYDKGMNAAGNWLADQTAGRYYGVRGAQ